MNIFILDTDMRKNAQYHVDKHISKMLIEQTQVLCSAYYFTDEAHKSPYKLTHQNHPCSIWARESLENWLWLLEMTIELYVEYQHRYNKNHKSGEVVLMLEIPNLPCKGLTPFAQAMPEQYKDKDAVKAYRAYYNAEKRHIFSWKNREMPNWITESENLNYAK